MTEGYYLILTAGTLLCCEKIDSLFITYLDALAACLVRISRAVSWIWAFRMW
jgi:hypothetical protein